MNTRQIGAVNFSGLVPTGTRSCSAYLKSVAQLVPARLNRRRKLTDVANCSEERQGIVLLQERRQDSRGIFQGEDSLITRDFVQRKEYAAAR
jgi:hypothetical protein